MTKIFWIAYVGKKEYKLTEAQYDFMKKQNLEHGTTTFWFDDFVISLPHVSSMDRVVESVGNLPKLPELSPEEHAKAQKKLQAIKQELKEKLSNEQTFTRN